MMIVFDPNHATPIAPVLIRDANGQALAYVYFEDEPQRQMSMKRLSSDEARRIAASASD